MATHLKKRALAEYAQNVVEENPRPAKTLVLSGRVATKPRSAELLLQQSPCDWTHACLSDASNSTVLAGLLALHYALPLHTDMQGETVEALLSLLQQLASSSDAERGEDEEAAATGGGDGAGPASTQDLLTQVITVLPKAIMASSSGDRTQEQLAVSAVECLCQCMKTWLQKERQRQTLVSQGACPANDGRCSAPATSSSSNSSDSSSSRTLSHAVRAAASLALLTPAADAAASLAAGPAAAMNKSPAHQVLRVALAMLSVHHHHLVKVSCLEAAGSLCSSLGATPSQENFSDRTLRLGLKRDGARSLVSSSSEVISALLHHATHHDNRVRTAAFKAMVRCEDAGVRLPAQAYTEVCQALEDDYQCVREAAIELIKTIAINDGGRIVPNLSSAAQEEPERLADHAFFRICGCMNDIAVRVRVSAARALSSIPGVSQTVLLQTLDKKLFSNMRRKLSYHERQAALVSSGQWSSGRAWGDDSVRETLSAEHTSLTHSAGAFVHGLEDECLEVRNASLDALSVLAEGSETFANQCLDFLVDMFNDEIEDVRLKAVQVLQRIVRHIRLQEDQLDEILHALKDSWQCIRESVHTLIGSCSLATTACLQATINALMDNIRRYPQDVPSIQRCMVSIGCRQSGLVAGLVPQQLLTHPYFDAVQPSLHQPHYICKLLLVLNAASKVPTILPLLEQHTLNHYRYLRDTLPNLVPQLKVNATSFSDSSVGDVLSNTEDFLQQSLSKLRRLENSSTQLRLTLYQSVHSDFIKLAALDPTMSAAAQFAALYTRCTQLLTRVLSCAGWLQQEWSGSTVQQLVTLTFRLVHAFSGLGPGDRACVRGMRLRALALQLVYVVNGSTGSALGLCEAFLNHARPLKESFNTLQASASSNGDTERVSNDTYEDPFLIAALNQLKDERRPGTVARTLQPLLTAHPPPALPPIVLPRAIHQASATITEPSQDSEIVHKLTAGLLLAVPMDARLYHVPEPRSVRIRIAYPDQSVQYVVPRASHLQPTDEPNCYRLQTTILLTAGVWSEACQVQVSLVLDLSPPGPKRKHDPHTIDLSEPTTLMLWPKPMKKSL
ncbi:Armadillo-type fold [Trinorchestia longiramus]|nr:Armadillo-type fold [Trinorchestia longiramus]